MGDIIIEAWKYQVITPPPPNHRWIRSSFGGGGGGVGVGYQYTLKIQNCWYQILRNSGKQNTLYTHILAEKNSEYLQLLN